MYQARALVLLERLTPVSSEYVIEKLGHLYPAQACEATSMPDQSRSHYFRCGGHSFAVTPVEERIPDDDALWERASLMWSEARNAVARHRALLVVSVEPIPSKLEAARHATAVVGALCALPGVLAINWNGSVGRSPQMWLEMAPHAFDSYPDYPIPLWIDIVPFASGQSAGALTVGLRFFIDREIELDCPGMSLSSSIDRVEVLASHVIEHGNSIEDGQALQISNSEQLAISHDVSRHNGAPVLRVGPIAQLEAFEQYPVISPAIARDDSMLMLLSQAGLFDVAHSANQVLLRPAAYESDQPLDAYDNGVRGALAKMHASEAYLIAAEKARAAMARGDPAGASAALRPFAEEVSRFQATIKYALGRGDLFMFLPKQTPTKLG